MGVDADVAVATSIVAPVVSEPFAPCRLKRRAADIERVGSGGCGEGAFERAVGEHVERRAGIALRQAVDRRAVQIVDAAGPGGGHRRQRRAAVEAEAVARRRRGRKGPAGVGVGVGSAEVQEPEQGVGVPGGRARVLRGKRAETLNCAAGGEADNACAGLVTVPPSSVMALPPILRVPPVPTVRTLAWPLEPTIFPTVNDPNAPVVGGGGRWW